MESNFCRVSQTEDRDGADTERDYTLEFRTEAVKSVEDEVLSVDAMAKRLSVLKSSLGNRICASKAGNQARLGYLSSAKFNQQFYAKQMAA